MRKLQLVDGVDCIRYTGMATDAVQIHIQLPSIHNHSDYNDRQTKTHTHTHARFTFGLAVIRLPRGTDPQTGSSPQQISLVEYLVKARVSGLGNAGQPLHSAPLERLQRGFVDDIKHKPHMPRLTGRGGNQGLRVDGTCL